MYVLLTTQISIASDHWRISYQSIVSHIIHVPSTNLCCQFRVALYTTNNKIRCSGSLYLSV